MDDSYEGLKGHFDLTTQAWLQKPRSGKYLEWVWDFPGEEGGQVPNSEGIESGLGFCWHPTISPTALLPGLLFPVEGLLTQHCSDRTKSPLCPRWHTKAFARMMGRLACDKAKWPSRAHRTLPLLSQSTACLCIPSAGQEVEEEAVSSDWYPDNTRGSYTPPLPSIPSISA